MSGLFTHALYCVDVGIIVVFFVRLNVSCKATVWLCRHTPQKDAAHEFISPISLLSLKWEGVHRLQESLGSGGRVRWGAYYKRKGLVGDVLFVAYRISLMKTKGW